MAQNVLDQATSDVAAHAQDARAMAQTLERHASTPMYVAEVVSLLQQQRAWDAVKKQIKDHDLIKSGESNAKKVDHAVKDANAHKDNAQAIRLDIEDNDDAFYGERYLARLHGLHKLQNIKNLDDQNNLFRVRAGRALGMAELDGIISGAEIVALGRPGVSQGITLDPLTGFAEQGAESTTDDAKHHLEDAQKKLSSLDSELQRQLREIGPAIWDPNEKDQSKIEAAQRRVQNYIADFKKSDRYRNAENDVRKWSNALHVQLIAHEIDIEAHGTDRNSPGEAKHGLEAIVDSYRDLAATPGHAVEAVRWAKQHENDKEYASLRGRVTNVAQIGQTTDASQRVQKLAQILRGEDQSKQAVLEAIKMIDEDVLTPYETIDGIKGLRELKGSLQNIRDHIGEFRARNAQTIDQLGAMVIHATAEGDPIVQRIGSAFGMMITVVEDRKKLVITTNFVAIGDNISVLYQQIDSFKKTIEKGLHDKVKITSEARGIQGKFLTLSKILGPLAVAAGALGVSEDITQLREDGNPAVAVKLVGDIASTVGAAIALFPPLAPIGDTISLIGQAISLIASGFIGDPVGDRRRDDEKDRLVRINAFDHGPHQKQLANTFTNDDAAGELQNAETLHMTLDEIKKLGAFHPFFFTNPHMINGAVDLIQFLTDKDNTKHGLGGLVSPFKDSVFNLLMASTRDDFLGAAISISRRHELGTSEANLHLVHLARLALPERAFEGAENSDAANA